MKTPSNPGLHRTYVNLKRANWDRYRQEVEAALSKRSLPTDCQRDEKIFRTVLLKAASHHIPTGCHRLHEEAVPPEILDMMNRQDDLRKRDPTSPELQRLNKTIQNRICDEGNQEETIVDGANIHYGPSYESNQELQNSKAFGPNKLSIFHLKHLGPRVIEYITTLFNLSATTCRIPAIWKSSLIIPIPKPGKDTSQGTSYRPISLICPAAKVLESLFLPTINKYLIPAQDQHGFRREHSTTSALLQLTTDVAVGFNQRKPPDRTVCVAVDLSAAFDTVCHNNLLSKINRSQLPPATARWLSCYLRGRQVKTCFRGVKSTSRKVNTGVPQGSKLLCCCLPTPMALASGGSPMFPLVVHQPASPSIWPAVQSLRRGLSINPGATMWCVCGCS